MALKKEAIDKVAKLLKIDPKKLTDAIADPSEVEVDISDDLSVLTKTELETRDNNTRNEGVQAGKELGYKDIKKEAGLPDDAPSKDPKKLFDAISKNVLEVAKINPDKRVTELQEQLRLKDVDLEAVNGKVKVLEEGAVMITTDRNILASMPKDRAEIFGDDEWLTAVKSLIKIETVDINGKQVQQITYKGDILRNATDKTPMDLKGALGHVFADRKGWMGTPGTGGQGGRGGLDSKDIPLGGFKKRSEVIKYYEDQGKSLNGQDGAEITSKLSELAKADTSFDMNS